MENEFEGLRLKLVKHNEKGFETINEIGLSTFMQTFVKMKFSDDSNLLCIQDIHHGIKSDEERVRIFDCRDGITTLSEKIKKKQYLQIINPIDYAIDRSTYMDIDHNNRFVTLTNDKQVKVYSIKTTELVHPYTIPNKLYSSIKCCKIVS